MRTKVLLSLSLFIGGVASATAAPCDQLRSIQDLLTCAQAAHPDVLRAQAKISGVEAHRQAARQRLNPDLDAQANVADTDAGSITRTEASIKHTFELGGKRRNRIEQAKAREALIVAEAERLKEEATIETVINIFRLRHNLLARRNIEEALGTFDKIVRQYRSRPQLPPEQRVSRDVFELAKADYEARKVALAQERRGLASSFALFFSKNIGDVEKAVGDWQPRWVDPKQLSEPAGKGAAWAILEAMEAAARSGVAAAKSEASPNLALGPMIERESGGGESSTGLGGALSLVLPAYQRNAGAIALARYEQSATEADVTQTRRELEALRASALDVYRMSVSSLSNASSDLDRDKKHEATESLFERGIVSASLIIEAHRQATEILERQNEQELRAAEALWSIYALDGRLSKESL